MKYLRLVILIFGLISFQTLLSAQIVDEPSDRHYQVRTVINEVTQETGVTIERPEGWLEYTDEKYTVELTKGIQPVRLLRVTNSRSYKSVSERLENIRERLEYAIDFIQRGKNPNLELRDDGSNVSIYCVVSPVYTDENDGIYPVRILTITERDAEEYPALDRFVQGKREPWDRTPVRLASYLAAQIEAHLQLFIKIKQNYQSYENLALDETSKGKIYREVFIRAREVAKMKNEEKQITATLVDDALDRVARQQRKRLQRRYYLIPRDWEQIYRGNLFTNR